MLKVFAPLLGNTVKKNNYHIARLKSETTYFSSSDWPILDFFPMTSPTCCDCLQLNKRRSKCWVFNHHHLRWSAVPIFSSTVETQIYRPQYLGCDRWIVFRSVNMGCARWLKKISRAVGAETSCLIKYFLLNKWN